MAVVPNPMGSPPAAASAVAASARPRRVGRVGLLQAGAASRASSRATTPAANPPVPPGSPAMATRVPAEAVSSALPARRDSCFHRQAATAPQRAAAVPKVARTTVKPGSAAPPVAAPSRSRVAAPQGTAPMASQLLVDRPPAAPGHHPAASRRPAPARPQGSATKRPAAPGGTA